MQASTNVYGTTSNSYEALVWSSWNDFIATIPVYLYTYSLL